MKTSDFEQRFTAWLDGKLSPEAAAEFEQEMRSRGFDPELERAAGAKLGSFLRKHSKAPSLPHAQFFNHLLMRQIEGEATSREAEPSRKRSWWGIPWMAWAGAACLLIAAVLFKTLIPVGGGSRMADLSPYFATIVDARTFDNRISATTVYDPKDNVTVLWLDGLEDLPADYVLQ